MKKTRAFLASFACLTGSSLLAQVGPGSPPASVQTNSVQTNAYTIIGAGANHRVVRFKPTATNSLASPETAPASAGTYTELAGGLNYFKDGRWLEATENIEIQPDGGAVGRHTQHRAYFPGGLYDDAFHLTLPDAAVLVSRPLGLAYARGDESVWVAELRDGPVGQLLSSGAQVLYTNVTSGGNCRLDVLASNRRDGCEYDLVIRTRLPEPALFLSAAAPGAAAQRIMVEWWTEFLSTPQPQERQQVLADGSVDTLLDFGSMTMPAGRAYLAGVSGTPRSELAVLKEWRVINKHSYLVERIPWDLLAPQLQALPEQASVAPPARHAPQIARSLTLPPSRAARHSGKPVLIARAETTAERASIASELRPLKEPGFIWDYTTLNSGLSNYRFRKDQTYYLSGSLSVGGTNCWFEGGTVLKFSNDVTLTVNAPVTWLGGTYRPVVMLGKDDNSCGESISGSSGNPGSTAYANKALYFDATTAATNLTLQGLRVANAKNAVVINGRAGHVLGDVQFVKCQNGLALTNAEVSLRNALFWQVQTNFTGSSSTGRVEHLTSDVANWLNKDIGSYLYLTNTLLVGVTNLGNYTTFQSVNTQPSGGGVFVVVGAGSHYLVDGSTNRHAGTTNINTALLSALSAKTTWPPLVFSNTTISSDLSLIPQAPRESGAPDVGFGYDPLDYVFGGVTASANLSFGPGTAVGWFMYNSYGIHLSDTYSASFNGLADRPDYWARNTVSQEGGNGLWNTVAGTAGITGTAWPNFGVAPVVNARFTRCSALGNDAMLFRDSVGYLRVKATHCEFWGGSLGGYASELSFTNCLFDRTTIWTSWDGTVDNGCSFTMRNCLHRVGVLSLSRSGASGVSPNYCQWTLLDTAFENVPLTFSDVAGGSATVTAFDYNSTITGTNRTNPTGAHDVMVSDFGFQSGPLGNYYLPTNSTLVDTGSLSSAASAPMGLYHFTTSTNQVKEATTRLNISYHYVAVNANGKPLDYDGDGIPDYIEDYNGNGTVDSGETDWQNYNSSNGLANGSGLQVFTPLK